MKKTESIIRWLARGLSGLILALGVLLIAVHLVGEDGHAARPLTPSDYVGLAMLLLLLVGSAVAWKWELPGGIMILGAYLILAVINWRVLASLYLIFPIEATMFLSSWGMRRYVQSPISSRDPAGLPEIVAEPDGVRAGRGSRLRGVGDHKATWNLVNGQSSDRLIPVLRIMAYFVALAPFVVLCVSLLVGGLKLELLLLYLALAGAGALCGSLSLVGHTAKGRAVTLCALAGGLLFGTVGFTTGYCRPDLFGWHGSLAPLAGVFVTGPMGFLGGALLGLVAGGIRALRCRFPIQNQRSTEREPENPGSQNVEDDLRVLSS